MRMSGQDRSRSRREEDEAVVMPALEAFQLLLIHEKNAFPFLS